MKCKRQKRNKSLKRFKDNSFTKSLIMKMLIKIFLQPFKRKIVRLMKEQSHIKGYLNLKNNKMVTPLKKVLKNTRNCQLLVNENNMVIALMTVLININSFQHLVNNKKVVIQVKRVQTHMRNSKSLEVKVIRKMNSKTQSSEKERHGQ